MRAHYFSQARNDDADVRLAINGDGCRRFPLDGYDGSKGGAGVCERIISQMVPHETFIECFVGSGKVTRRKLPARSTIVIDSDAAVIAAWKKFEACHAICSDAISWLERRKWQGNELVYCDPPYLLSTRSWKARLYRHEFETAAQHIMLLKVLRTLPVPVMISGYASPLYARLLKGWRAISYQTTTRAGRAVTEWLWMNYPEPFELHDYRFLGDGFRERERIKRKKLRWQNRLQKMPTLERMAILAAIDDARSIISARSPKTLQPRPVSRAHDNARTTSAHCGRPPAPSSRHSRT